MAKKEGTNIEVGVNLEINASMWDCLKMRLLGFTKNAIYEYLDHCKSKQYERNLLQNINDGILTTESIVNELAKREGVQEIVVGPHQPFIIQVKGSDDTEFSYPSDVKTGPARILVVID